MQDPDEAQVGTMVAVGGICLLLALLHTLYKLWRRLRRPNFVTDEHGERQRVIAWNRGQPVYDPTTWQQRIHEEVIVARKRRLNILGAFGILLPVFGAAIWLGQYSPVFPVFILWGGAIGIIPLLLIGIPALVQEIAYQLGYQRMQGAKVLDQRPPPPPGREVVEQQKAHGDARVAGEAEALSLLRTKR